MLLAEEICLYLALLIHDEFASSKKNSKKEEHLVPEKSDRWRPTSRRFPAIFLAPFLLPISKRDKRTKMGSVRQERRKKERKMERSERRPIKAEPGSDQKLKNLGSFQDNLFFYALMFRA